MLSFPLASKQDARHFNMEIEDVSMKSEMDGGYVLSRPRHTRAPRKTFKTGFTDISNVDKLTLEAFYESVRAGSDVFLWSDPIDAVQYTVRFKDKMKFQYAGISGNHRWNVSDIMLEQA